MSEIKKHLKFKEDRDNLASRILELQGEIERLNKEIELLEDAALKAEILETADFKQKKEAVKKQREKLIVIKTELEESKKKLKVRDSLLPGFQEKARIEAVDKHRRIFKEAWKPFVAKLRDMLESEHAMEAILGKAYMEFSDNGLGPCPIVAWTPFTCEHPHSEHRWEEQIKGWDNQIKGWENEGHTD